MNPNIYRIEMSKKFKVLFLKELTEKLFGFKEFLRHENSIVVKKVLNINFVTFKLTQNNKDKDKIEIN
jgi:hypothetical protein